MGKNRSYWFSMKLFIHSRFTISPLKKSANCLAFWNAVFLNDSNVMIPIISSLNINGMVAWELIVFSFEILFLFSLVIFISILLGLMDVEKKESIEFSVAFVEVWHD